MPEGKGRIYKVVNAETDGVINEVEHAENERDTDSQDIKNKKRREEAERKMHAWTDTLYAGHSLKVVEEKSYG